MGIEDISGKVSAFWLRAKSALSSGVSERSSASKDTPRPAGDSADLPHKGQYFAGYASPDAGAEGPLSPASGDPGGDSKLWAPLVISPLDPSQEPPESK